jgi:ankyrin repeat protein
MDAWKDDFHTAIGNKDGAAMQRALAKGLPVGEYVFGSNREYTPLLYAVDNNGGAAVVAALIASGADVNAPVQDSYRATPLGLAARRGSLPVVQQLLAAGADVNYSGPGDVTPLSFATGNKTLVHRAVTKALLKAGAQPTYQALIAAARHGSPEMIEMLAKAGADLNEVSRWGTALILAVHEKRVDTTGALLKSGADPNLRLPLTHGNYPGQTALDVAKQAKAKKVLPLLEAAAGKQTIVL